ncbi:MAG: penicillin-binding protein 1A [Pseudomonadales bacterium]|nr:penicillin-binding protein 1A [Pseudomonadales bacterium]MCP5213715.1 penicillin-binding protein 1A [Pseudomonadales bacterium]
MTVPNTLKQIFYVTALFSICLVTLIITGLSLYLNPQLPSVESLRTIKLQTPLQIFSSDKKLIAEFGEKRRTPINIQDVPNLFVNAILAAEDDRFEQHHGVDIKSLMRAALQLVATGNIQTGGSTITMQVAKNYFLSRERTFSRKFNEILLALQIEQALSKEEILELYVNKIYLGNRAYGIQAAAQVYYGKEISELNLAQLAMIAGLPKAPSKFNPIANPERALQRRDWILQRMIKLKQISQTEYDEAIAQPITAKYHGLKPELYAPYVAEMVRAELLKKYPAEELYTSGLRIYTSLDSKLQKSANLSVQKGLLDYDRRHGYRGAEGNIQLDTDNPIASAKQKLNTLNSVGPLRPAIVMSVHEQSITALLAPENLVEIPWDGLKWARPFINTNATGLIPKSADMIVKTGDIIRLYQNGDNQWILAQIPTVQSALASLRPKDGAILALVGGFDFQQSKFNRATQATRQPGSNFKPFLYTAALEQGYTAASMINDAPVVFDDALLENTWRPENYSGKFFGPTRLRQALYQSRNLVSIRLLRAITIPVATSYVTRFGFDAKRLPRDLSLALGSAEFTPLEIATGYATFANGGYKINPYLIDSIQDNNGSQLFKETPRTVCPECESQQYDQTHEQNNNEDQLAAALLKEIKNDQQSYTQPAKPESASLNDTTLSEIQLKPIKIKVLPAERIVEARVAYIMNSMLKDVIRLGTGRRARSLGRSDIGGKTGTTNDQKDAWFSGFNQNVATTVWVGFDQPQTLGKREVGGYAALPIWIDFMKDALAGTRETSLAQPNNLVTLRIDPSNGLRAQPGQPNAIFEIFRAEYVPSEISRGTELSHELSDDIDNVEEQLF